MAVVIEYLARQFTIEDGEWRVSQGEAPGTLAYLQSLVDPNGPSGSDPYPDLTIARNVVEQLGKGATIVNEGRPKLGRPGRIH